MTGKPEVIHLVVKPVARTSDRCQLARYGCLDERIIAEARFQQL
jgi:hypothetical protein